MFLDKKTCGILLLMLVLGTGLVFGQPSIRAVGVKPLTDGQKAEHDFLVSDSAGLFVGVREFRRGFSGERSAIQEIPYAADDAVDLAYLFSFELNLISPDKVYLALSGDPQKPESVRRLGDLTKAGAVRAEATYINLIDLPSHVGKIARPKGLLVMSFATHGYMKTAGQCLLARDSSLENVDSTSLAVEKILRAASDSLSPRRLILIDACREKLSETRAGMSVSEESRMNREFLNALTAAKGMVTITSTVPGGFSFDDPRGRNGVFTAAIIRGLKGAAPADERNFITPATLVEFVNQEVCEWIRINKPLYAAASTGIGSVLEDPRSFRMPLAYAGDPAERLLGILHAETVRKGGMARTYEEVARALKNASPENRKVLVEKLEGFDRMGSRYLDVFVTWWGMYRYDMDPTIPRPTPVQIVIRETPGPTPTPLIIRETPGPTPTPIIIRETPGPTPTPIIIRQTPGPTPTPIIIRETPGPTPTPATVYVPVTGEPTATPKKRRDRPGSNF